MGAPAVRTPRVAWRLYLAVAAAACVVIALAVGLPLGLLLASHCDEDEDAGHGGPSVSACWKPLQETDGRGFTYDQKIVASVLRHAGDEAMVRL